MAYQGAAPGRPDVLVELSSTAGSFGSGSAAAAARTSIRLAG
jgi:hypothetical protein